jgi:hypothetical protein
MKKFSWLITSLFVFSSVVAQEFEKRYFENNPTLGGDVVIKSASVKVLDDEISKIFEIESPSDGEYYLDAWIMVPSAKESYPEYKIAVNGVVSTSSLKPQSDNWQSVALTNLKKVPSTLRLKSGKNSIAVIGKGNEIPDVEFIKLSSSSLRTGIPDSNFKTFFEKIQTAPQKIALASDSVDVITRGTNGEIFTYKLDYPVYYTTRKSFYYSSGQTVSITTSQSGNYEHVIEFFSANNPATYTWTAFSSGNGSLNVTIPVTGTYYLRLRAYRQTSSGLVNLSVNGTSYSNCIVSGSGIAISGSYSTNFFTCKLTGGDTWMVLEDNSGLPGKVRAYNDDFGSTSDGYSWGFASRIGSSLTTISAGLISAYSSNNPDFNCDLYLGLAPSSSTVRGYFPNLAADNSFMSAASTTTYNCISWSVGKRTSWDWPGNSLSAFDSYYQSYGYTRTGADASNAAIALWAYNGSFTHASVRKNTTILRPNGFEWESKCGSLERVMHIRDALSGNSYGNIVYYYKPINGTIYAASPLKISESETAYGESFFVESELNQISALKNRLPASILSGFEDKYLAWSKTWDDPKIAIYSNPYKYAESEEYSNLLGYSSKYGKAIWALLVDKLANEDIFVVNLLKDLTYTGKKDFIDHITPNVEVKIGTPVPSLYSNLVEYCKQLLINEEININKSIEDINTEVNDTFSVSVKTLEQNIIIDITAEKNAVAFVKVFDIYGISVYEANHSLSGSGTVAVSINTNLKKGIYIVQVTVGSETLSQKINL